MWLKGKRQTSFFGHIIIRKTLEYIVMNGKINSRKGRGRSRAMILGCFTWWHEGILTELLHNTWLRFVENNGRLHHLAGHLIMMACLSRQRNLDWKSFNILPVLSHLIQQKSLKNKGGQKTSNNNKYVWCSIVFVSMC